MKVGPLLLVPLMLGGCIDVVTRSASDEGNGIGNRSGNGNGSGHGNGNSGSGNGDRNDEGPRVIGTGKPVTERRIAKPVAAAEFAGALIVDVHKGPPALTVEAQKEILPHLKSSFERDRLRVWIEGSATTNGAMRVHLTMPDLHSIDASGATHVAALGVDASRYSVVLAGASEIEAKGTTRDLILSLSGASTATTRFLQAKRVEIHLEGASTANVAASRELVGEATGASSVFYMKRPDKLSVETSGASSVSVDK